MVSDGIAGELRKPAPVPSGFVVDPDSDHEACSVGSTRKTSNVATMVFEEMDDSGAFQDATGFIRSHPGPSEWEDTQDAGDWLEALAEASPYSRVTLAQLPVDDGSGG